MHADSNQRLVVDCGGAASVGREIVVPMQVSEFTIVVDISTQRRSRIAIGTIQKL